MNPLKAQKMIAKSSLWLAVFLLMVLHAVTIRADSTDGRTPLALQPGAPAGSYALSDFDNINPYNGSLNFRLPILNIGGRGQAAYTMTLPLEQKWRINAFASYLYVYEDGGNGVPLPEPNVTYHYFPSANWWTGIKPGYGPGVMHGRVAQFDAQVCQDSTMRAVMTLTRLTFTAPDGTEFELRDKQTDGAPASVGLCQQTGFNRGKIFVTADGSAATFISDQNIVDYIVVPNSGNDLFYPSGYLLLRDGTRYRLDGGKVTWLRDRNGNKLTFTYDSFSRMTMARDSLNRAVTVTYSTSTVPYDEIVYKGFGGAPRTIRVNYAQLEDPGSLRSGYSSQTYYQLFPMTGSSTSSKYNPKVVRSVTLPNNQQYQFQYNAYGELARVVLPTGGAFEYDYASGVPGDPSGIAGSMNIYRRVISRRVYSDGVTLESKMTFSNTESVPCSGCVLIDQFGSDGTTRISQKQLYYQGSPLSSFDLAPTDYSPWKDGREYKSESLTADGTTILRRTENTWEQPTTGNSWPLTQAETNAAAKANNPQITQTVTTLEPAQANKVSKQTFAYDKYTNQTDVYEYDFGSGSPGAQVRHTRIHYLTSNYDTLNPNSTSPDLNQTSHIRNLPAQVSIFDSAGATEAERARSVTEYDNYVLDGANCQNSFHCPLLPRINISGLDSLFDTNFTRRGNPTAVTRYLLSNGVVTGSVSSYSQYDMAGNVVRVLDPRSTLTNNIATTIEYDDRFGAPDHEAQSNSTPGELSGYSSFAFPTRIMNPLGHTTFAQFDYHLGKSVNGQDANGVIAAGYFNDALDRPTQIRRAVGTDAENQTTFTYDDANRVVTTSSDRDAYGDNLLVSKVVYDQLGRTIEMRQYESAGNYIVTQTQYDALGRAFKTSSPFRPWQGEGAFWTTQSFDALGRMISVTTPDNAVVSTSYSGNSVTVTDQAGKSRRSLNDALGHVVEVFEDPSGLNYQTSYKYDVLDNLVKVTQGVQQRFFMYDSLKRLIRVRNPEQGTLGSLNLSDPITNNNVWSIAYQYDANGNLTQRTDARGVVSTYVYDALNRNTTTDYSDTPSINPDVKLFYDNVINGIGRFYYSYRGGDHSIGSNVEHTAIDSYDALGRPLVQRQLFRLNGTWSTTYQVTRTYNRAGGVRFQTYPSGHSVSYTYDAVGRTSSFSGNLGDGSNRTYAANISYSPFGGLSREQFGTDTALYHKSFYNIRGQLFDTRLSSVDDMWDWNRGRLILYYSSNHLWGQSGTDNNGNVLFAQTWIPPETATLDQMDSLNEDSYSYDVLNRLKSVTEARLTAATGIWQSQFVQTYNYDRYGNRTILPAPDTVGTGINDRQFTVDPTTNRLGVPANQPGVMTYDAAGNLTNDTYTGSGGRLYDADNKMTAAQDAYGGWSYYSYDANGQRVRRKSNGRETWQIHGMEGELLAEYAANGSANNPQKEYGYRNGQLLITAESNAGAPSSGLAGNWKFDENGGTTAVDASGNGNTGTLTSGASWSAGQSGTATSLDGADAYVQVGAQTSLVLTSAASFSAWIYPTGPGSLAPYGGIIINKEGEYEIARFQDGTIQWAFANSNPAWNWINTGYVAPLNQWTHVAVTYDNGVVNTYINGTLIHTYSGSGAMGDISPAQNDFRVGGRQSASQNFQGRIDDVRVYNRALTAGEVSTLPGGSGSSGTQINWLVTDHLGTPRMIVNQTGAWSNVRRDDYLPFGEELVAGIGSRTAAQGYSPGDGVRQQFTAKERDNETGLDYFGARYFASTQGRFTSSDPLLASGRPRAPQSWNRYSYVLNNPLSLIDPTGLADDDPQDPKKLNEQSKRVAVDQITVGGVTVKVEQMNEPAGFQKVINGTERVGVGVQLNFTISDEDGKPVEGATAVESVSAIEGPEIKQNPETVRLDRQGRGSDFVTNSAPTPKSREEAQALVQQIKDPFITKQEFNLTITLKGGTQIEVTQVRTLTNKTSDGKLQPEDRGLGFGVGVPGYTFTMEKMKGRVIQP